METLVLMVLHAMLEKLLFRRHSQHPWVDAPDGPQVWIFVEPVQFNALLQLTQAAFTDRVVSAVQDIRYFTVLFDT